MEHSLVLFIRRDSCRAVTRQTVSFKQKGLRVSRHPRIQRLLGKLTPSSIGLSGGWKWGLDLYNQTQRENVPMSGPYGIQRRGMGFVKPSG